MNALFKKLNLSTQREIALFNAPPSLEADIKSLEGIEVLRDPKKPAAVTFALAFATLQADLDRLSTLLAGAAVGDAILWFAYPKRSSKRYRCEFNRDAGWHVMQAAGFESVRMVAIDEDWCALRFRRAEFVKSKAAKPSRTR